MPILATFEKQPADVQDFDIDFATWLVGMVDSAPGPSDSSGSNGMLNVEADDGIQILAYVLNQGVAKIWTAGGTHGKTYKITATLTTVGNRVKQAEIKVKVKEY